MNIISASMLVTVVCGDDVSQLGRPENNIINLKNQNHFTFSAVNIYGGSPKNVADEQEDFSGANWATFGIETNADSTGISYPNVDLKQPYILRAFAVNGYPGGGHKPTGEFYLEGSNNAQTWKMVGVGKPSQWLAPGTYPFKKEQVVPAIYPNSYRYYRVIANGWTNNRMVIYNWGLFV